MECFLLNQLVHGCGGNFILINVYIYLEAWTLLRPCWVSALFLRNLYQAENIQDLNRQFWQQHFLELIWVEFYNKCTDCKRPKEFINKHSHFSQYIVLAFLSEFPLIISFCFQVSSIHRNFWMSSKVSLYKNDYEITQSLFRAGMGSQNREQYSWYLSYRF